MSPLGQIYSFRARIALVLILTLVVATAVLYKLNQRAETNIIQEVDKQRRDLANAINVAQRSLTSSQYVREFLEKERSRDPHESHVERILVVNSQGKVEDSSDADDMDKPFDSLGFGAFAEAIDLKQQRDNQPYKIYTFPLQTRSEASADSLNQVIYIIIVFSDDLTRVLQASSLYRLLATASVLLVSIIVSLFLILQFTRPLGK